ncbi:MAG: protease HtpX [Verrucomicrobiae bacterium]|nr:protease HtpX [Verrucomicrobiae bacterium]
MKRIILFVLTNIAVLAVLAVAAHLLGVDKYLTSAGLNLSMLLIFSAILGFSGSFISLLISKWMAKMAYGIQVIDRPQDATEAWLVNTVARFAEQAGIRTPEVGIYDSPEVNAFATGPTRNNALVAVSSGLLRQMNQRQAEAVLAHEVAHVANGDMVTMTLLQGVLNTFVVFLSRVFGFLIDSALRRDNDRGGVGIGYFLGSIVCQIVLGILATMIVMAYSRHREYRADAMGAQLAGRSNMISALQRLNEIMHGGGVLDDRSPALSAFKINNKPSGLLALFASHPPLEKRIEALQRMM